MVRQDRMKEKCITFYDRFEQDIIQRKKIITIRIKSDANYEQNDIVRVSTYKVNKFFANIRIISVQPIHFSDLNEHHATQENMSLQQLKEVITEIYPGQLNLYLIEFTLIDTIDKLEK